MARIGSLRALVRFSACAATICMASGPLQAQDCDEDGVPDAEQIAADPDLDCNTNGALDACELAPGELAFHTARLLPTELNPVDLAAVDLDGDENMDLVATNEFSGSLSIYRGLGDGTFMVRPPIDVGGTVQLPVSVAAGNINDDEDPDLLLVDTGQGIHVGYLQILLNDGTGELLDAGNIQLDFDPARAVLAHMDADLELDIVVIGDFVSDGPEPKAAVLFNDGTGSFTETRTLTTGGLPGSAVEVADLDDNGRLDVIVTIESSDELLIFFANGVREFETAATIAVGVRPRGVTAADLDGDDDPDLAVAEWGPTILEGGSVLLLRNDGGGNLVAETLPFAGLSPTDIAIVDLDADDLPDIAVVTETDRRLSILWNEGNAGFSPATFLGVGEGGRQQTLGVVTAPLDADSLPDLVVSSKKTGSFVPGNLAVVLNRGARRFSAEVNELVLNRATAVGAGDLDADGDQDLVVGLSPFSELSQILLFENLGGGKLRPRGTFDLGEGDARALVVADLDGDGRLDVVTANEGFSNSGNASALFNGGGFNFNHTRLQPGESPQDVAVGDVDGDNDLDLVFANAGMVGNAVLLRNEGAGTFAPPEVLPGVAGQPEGIDLGDFNGDDKLDVVVVSEDTEVVSVLLNGGGGLFEDPDVLPLGGSPRRVRSGDIDGDGSCDFVVSQSDAGELTVFWNDGDGQFSQNSTLGSPGGPASVWLADVDVDGRLDVAVVSPLDDRFRVFRNEGERLFAPRLDVPVGDFPTALTFADVDGDARLDAVIGSSTTEEVSLFFNATPYPLAADCNDNDTPDICDLQSGTSFDSNSNGIPDECDPDCNTNGTPDDLDIVGGTSTDLNLNEVPDECDPDCNSDGVPDDFEISSGAADCNENALPDTCDIAGGSADLNLNGVPDECEPDCNSDGVPDDFEISSGVATDCNENGLPDACDIAGGMEDLDGNGLPDVCPGENVGQIPGDCNQDGVLDLSDTLCTLGVLFTGRPPVFPCGDGSATDAGNIGLMDWQPDGSIDLADVVGMLQFLFFSADAHVLAVPGAETAECVVIPGCEVNLNCP